MLGDDRLESRGPGARLSRFTKQPLTLGLFGANLAGIDMTTVPERWKAEWVDNVAVAQAADDAGLDFLLPVSRWRGYEGATDPQGTSFETITWACGLLAQTRRITVFATVHVPMVHPLFAAKQFVTADHIGAGRFGLNVVCGWNEAEFEMFGIPRDAERRYEYAREWLDIVKLAWSRKDTFDYAGSFFDLARVRAEPKPCDGSRPLLLNAGQSPEGRAFAHENCDILFSSPPNNDLSLWRSHLDQMRATAPDDGLGPVFTAAMVICRRTRAEAEEFHRYCLAHPDEAAIDLLVESKQRSGRGLTEDGVAKVRDQMSKATAVYIIGDPDDVATAFADMHAAGVAGIAMLMPNQRHDLPLFVDEVLPRLERLGCRLPFEA